MVEEKKKRRTEDEQIAYHEERIRVKKSRKLMRALRDSDEGKKIKRLVYDLNWLRRKSKDERLQAICRSTLERVYIHLADRLKEHKIKPSDIAQAVDSEYEAEVESDVTQPAPPA